MRIPDSHGAGAVHRAAISALAAAALAACAVSSGCSSSCATRDDSRGGIRSVKVPAAWTAEGRQLPSELQDDSNGNPVRNQSYSIGEDGLFTFTRSVEVEAAYLGAELRELDKEHAKRLGLEPFSGVRVRSVVHDSPASRGGIRAGDVVTAFGDEKASSAERLHYLISSARPKTLVDLSVWREGTESTVQIELGAQRRIQTGASFQCRLEILDDRARSGLRLAALSPEIRPLVLGPEAGDEGVLILHIVPGSSAFYSDLRAGDLLVQAAERPMRSIEDFSAALADAQEGDDVALAARRGSRKLEATIEIAEDATSDHEIEVLLFDYGRSPSRTKFSLLEGLLFNYRHCRSIEKHAGRLEHHTSNAWGCILNLLKYESQPDRAEFRIAWLLPIRWKRDHGERERERDDD
jgi:hypothetical protein